MATIRINRQAAHSGQLPQVCICCGTPTQQFVRHEFRFEPTWLILLLTVFPKLWMFLSYETFNLNLPVCSSHTTRFKWPSIAGLVTAGVLFLLLIPIIALSVTGNADKLLIVIPIFLLVIVAYVVTRFTLLFSGPRVVQYSSGTLELAGVSEEFARHVSGHGGFQQAPQYPPQQVYTGNYGLTQAAYQNTYRPAAGPSNRTLWIVLAAVFGPLALLGLLAFGVLFSREYARFSEKRQFADMRADFRETMARDQIESQQRAAEFQRKRREAQARALSEPPPTTPSQPSASTPAPTFQAGEAVFFQRPA